MRCPSIKATLTITFGVALLLFVSCESETVPAGEILAKIGDRVITKEDFMRRSEYTIRPDYCSGTNYIHRKIILNSLVSEKLLALEHPDSPIKADSDFNAYIQGRQEQTMRQWLFKKQAFDAVVIDTSELKRSNRLASRTYNIQFVSLPDSNAAKAWNAATIDGYDFETMARSLSGSDSIPEKSLTWFDREDINIRSAIFDGNHQKGAEIGPLALEDGQYIVLKLEGWVDRPAVTELSKKQQWEDVQTRLIEVQADDIYKRYVGTIMADKEMNLNRDVFKSYSARSAQLYLRSAEDKKKMLNRAVWNAEEQVFTESLNDLPGGIPGDALLFDVNGEAWTIDRFEAYLKKHPLVFRSKTMSQREFPEQLKYAMADMVRDYYLTEEAYRLGYDEVTNVVQSTQMWEDHYVSRQSRNDYLRSAMDSLSDSLKLNETDILETYMDPYMDSLQNKYSDVISINTDLFEDIELSNIPMMVSNRNVPFPLSVPAFPRLTTDNKLNYGRKMGD